MNGSINGLPLANSRAAAAFGIQPTRQRTVMALIKTIALETAAKNNLNRSKLSRIQMACRQSGRWLVLSRTCILYIMKCDAFLLQLHQTGVCREHRATVYRSIMWVFHCALNSPHTSQTRLWPWQQWPRCIFDKRRILSCFDIHLLLFFPTRILPPSYYLTLSL